MATFENSVRTIAASLTEEVSDYYGKVLENSEDLQTNCCTTSAKPSDFVLEALRNVHSEVKTRYYGCGLVVPDQLAGLRILDLGCGAGRDCYMLSQWVGSTGRVVGVDMTDEQLAVAKKYIEWHRQRHGYAEANVEFYKGYIERLSDLDFPDNSFDIIVSNCVINLSPDKEAVLKEAYRILKPGGELFFSDVYADRRIPLELRRDQVLWGECLSGALYWNDFIRLSKQCGFTDPRYEDRTIGIKNKAIESRIGHIKFFSATYRLWKLPSLEPDCEDYGQAVRYKGTILNSSRIFKLDGHHLFEVGKMYPVCGNTYSMLHESRFAEHFEFFGDFSQHYGIFPGCGGSFPFASSTSSSAGCDTGGSCC